MANIPQSYSQEELENIKKGFCALIDQRIHVNKIWSELSRQLESKNIFIKPLYAKKQIIKMLEKDKEVRKKYKIIEKRNNSMTKEQKEAEKAFKEKDKVVANAVKMYYKEHKTLSLIEIYNEIINKNEKIREMSIDPLILYFNIKRLAEKDKKIEAIIKNVESNGVKLVDYNCETLEEKKVAAFLKFYESHMYLTYYELCEQVAETEEMQKLGVSNPLTVCNLMRKLKQYEKYSSLNLCRGRKSLVKKRVTLSSDEAEVVACEFKNIYESLIFDEKYYNQFVKKYENNISYGFFGSICLELSHVLSREYHLNIDSNKLVKKVEYLKTKDETLQMIIYDLHDFEESKKVKNLQKALNEISAKENNGQVL